LKRNVAWAAGLFEGEGSIAIGRDKRRGHDTIQLSLSSTDEDVVRAFHQVIGTGYVELRPYADRKDQYKWRCCRRREIAKVLDQLAPYFGERRALRARQAIPLTMAYDWRKTGY
jgi:hypothetical protein